jgi:transcriptional regulator with XRE-family HTH domain
VFEIGNSLREARERQGRTLSDIERKTEIRTRYLKALEEENFELMPALAYTRGFLRVYADELGLDGQLYVDEFNSRFSVSDDRSPPHRGRDKGETRHSRRIASGSVILALAVITVLIALIFAAFSSNSGDNKTTPPPGTISAKDMVALKLTAVRGDVSIEVHRGARSGELLYGGTLIKGHSKTFTAQNVWVKVSAAQNIVWKIRGGPSLDTRDRFGPATLIFTPRGHRFLTG